jgi:hypothetical protein
VKVLIRGAPRTGKTSLFRALQGRVNPAALQYVFHEDESTGRGASRPDAAAKAAFYTESSDALEARLDPSTESTPEIQSAKVGWRFIASDGYMASAAGSASPFGLLSAAVSATDDSVARALPGFAAPSAVAAANASFSSDFVSLDLWDVVDTGIPRLLPTATLTPVQRSSAVRTLAPTDVRHPAHPSFEPSAEYAYGAWYVQLRQQTMLAALVATPRDASVSAAAKAQAAAAAVRACASLTGAAEAAQRGGAAPAAVASVLSTTTADELLASFDPLTSFAAVRESVPSVPLSAVPSVDAGMLSDVYHGTAAMVVCVDPRRADSLQYCASVINSAPKHLDILVVLGFRDCRGAPGEPMIGLTVEQVEQVRRHYLQDLINMCLFFTFFGD